MAIAFNEVRSPSPKYELERLIGTLDSGNGQDRKLLLHNLTHGGESIELSPGQKTVFITDTELWGGVRLIDLSSGKSLFERSDPHPKACVRKDWKVIAVCNETTIDFIDTQSGRVLASQTIPNYMTAISFTPDRKSLATGTSKGKISLWDVRL